MSPEPELDRDELYRKIGRVVYEWTALETQSVTFVWAITDLRPNDLLLSLLLGGTPTATLWDTTGKLLEHGPDSDLVAQFRDWRSRAGHLHEKRNATVHRMWNQWKPAPGLPSEWSNVDIWSKATRGSGMRFDTIRYSELDDLADSIREAGTEIRELQAEISKRWRDRRPPSVC